MPASISNKIIIIIYKLLLIIGIGFVLWLLYKASRTTELSSSTIKGSLVKKKAKDDTNELILQNPIFVGVDEEQKPYEIAASKATKISEDQFDLENVDAKYKLSNEVISILAKKGTLSNDKKNITLNEEVDVLFNSLLMNALKLEIDLPSRDIKSDSAVIVNYKNSMINADSFISKDGGNMINFRGHVRTKFNISDF